MSKYQSSIALLSYLFSLSSFAGPSDLNFQERKQEHLKTLEKRIEGLQAAQACIQTAQDVPALKQCHEKLQSYRRQEQEENINRKIQKLQDRKNAPKKSFHQP